MKVFYSADYTAAAEVFDTTRKAGWIAESLSTNPVDGVDLVVPTALCFEDIARSHDPKYVKAVRRGDPLRLAESQGFRWDPGMWTGVTASNGGVVEAARAAMRDGVSGSLSSGMHHAQYARGAAFCTFNGLVIAARRVLDEGAHSILILDLDAHCGGGTHSMIEEENRIRQVDIAVNVVDAYWQNHGNTLDIVREAEKYLSTIESRLNEIGTFDLCLYNAGMDLEERCETGGVAGITAEILENREQMVFDWAKRTKTPIAFVLAGGYAGVSLPQAELVRLHRLTLDAASAIQ